MIKDAMISALAALSGGAIGGITPLISNYLIQRGLTERELLNRQLADRQGLYSDFIQFATKLYVSVTTNGPQEEKLDDLISLYALISRMRLYASAPVVEAAEGFAATVTERYGNPGVSIAELRSELERNIDPLNGFSIRCRDELREILRKGAFR
jgi:hypothetical protein